MISERTLLPENQTDLETGKIKFYNNYLSDLPAGDYRINLTHQIEGDGLDPKTFTASQDFEVAGPRFALPEGEIHSVYPPANGEDDYKGVLPQITFRKRTLPWERAINSKAEETEGVEIPSMALLLFEEQEIVFASSDNPRKATRTKAVSRETKDMITPPGNYLPPLEQNADNKWQPLSAGLGDEPSCYTIDISKADFEDLVPRAKELPYLAHVREVNTDDKEFLGMHADGWFSVMLSNRLPKTPPVQSVAPGSLEEKKGVNFSRNIVHLVSLEGFIGYLEDNMDDDDVPSKHLNNNKYSRVRLASLASWEFYCKPPLEAFSNLMENLDADLLRIKTGKDDLKKHPYLKTALEGGYIPLQYNTRNGEQTTAWYRGPLIPVINEYEPKTKDEDAFFSVEASMIYDDEQGFFDLSQAAAWQIGRLLALNDAHFSQTLLDWKIKVNHKIDELLKRQELVLPDVVQTSRNTTSFATLDTKKIQELMQPDFATDVFSDNFLEQLAVARDFFDKRDNVPDLLEMELAEFPGIIEEETFKDLLKRGKDPQEGLLEKVFDTP